MNKTVMYRTQGTAALKPEFIDNNASILDFETIKNQHTAANFTNTPVKLHIKLMQKIATDPLLSKYRFAKGYSNNCTKNENRAFMKATFATFAGVLALILIGA